MPPVRFRDHPRTLTLLWVGIFACTSLWGQSTIQAAPASDASSSTPASTSLPDTTSPSVTPLPEGDAAIQKPPAVIDPTGPAIAMETSEAVFDVMAGLNACGYDDELAISDPIRQKVRDMMNQALAQSEEARTTRDKLCAYVRSRRMSDPRHNLARYVSLALYLNPPPNLSQSVPTADLPPDAEPLTGYIPLLQAYAGAINLHLIWVLNHPAYDAEINKLHDPLTKMILGVDLYLKQPPSGYDQRRFLILLEPQIAPGQVNARVYGSNYVIVASPVNGVLQMKDIKHTYLHYELEPLLYARSTAIDMLLPLLVRVQDAPIPYADKSDIVALVTECMIRAIEARTMDTGVPVYKVPTHIERNQMVDVNNKINAHDKQVAAIRQSAVNRSMTQGYILTQYFYNQFKRFEHSPISLQEAVGEMVYGMNVQVEKSRVQHLVFANVADDEDVVERPGADRHAPDQDTQMLDKAEQSLASGNTAQAAQLADKDISQHTGDVGRAQFILARVDIMDGKLEGAIAAFQQSIAHSTDPRTVAWSHIYLGRIYDVQNNRDEAVTQYQEALRSRDSRPDTKQAAEQGLKQPYGPPPHAEQPTGSATPAGGPSN